MSLPTIQEIKDFALEHKDKDTTFNTLFYTCLNLADTMDINYNALLNYPFAFEKDFTYQTNLKRYVCRFLTAPMTRCDTVEITRVTPMIIVEDGRKIGATLRQRDVLQIFRYILNRMSYIKDVKMEIAAEGEIKKPYHKKPLNFKAPRNEKETRALIYTKARSNRPFSKFADIFVSRVENLQYINITRDLRGLVTRMILEK